MYRPVSLNVRGLGNNAKRKEVFNWLRAKKQSIYMLQEVHCSQDTTTYGLVSGVQSALQLLQQ